MRKISPFFGLTGKFGNPSPVPAHGPVASTTAPLGTSSPERRRTPATRSPTRTSPTTSPGMCIPPARSKAVTSASVYL